MGIANHEARVEFGHAANPAEDPQFTAAGFNGNTEHVASAGGADTANLGRERKENNGIGTSQNIIAELRALLGHDVVLK